MIIKKMFRALYAGCLFLFLVLSIFPIKAYSKSMSSYCSIPPFLISSVTPNVLFVVDNSGSMKFAAYWPKHLGKDKTDTSFNPSYKYYGIFDSDSQYSYHDSDNYFYKDSNGDWSGNFLNWLTMRRYDILLKILVGGNYKTIGTNDFLQGFNIIEKYADYLYKKNEKPYGYKFKKKYEESESDNYFPYDYSDEIFYVGIDYDGSRDGDSRNDRFWFEVDGDKYAIRVKIDGKPTGILQKTAKKVRVGLIVFNHGELYENNKRYDGGKVVSYILHDNTNLASLYVDQDFYDKEKYPNKPDRGYPPLYPHTYTPLAETYYEAIRYFEATQSAYNEGVDYANHDPIQYMCQKNFVILITDGGSTKDENLPGTYFNGHYNPVSDPNFNVKTWMYKIADNEDYNSQWRSHFSSSGTYYLEGAAYYSHVSDLRSDLPGKQNLTLYTIYTFGKSSRAERLLETAAKYGGFKDLNGDGKPDLQAEWDKDGDGISDNYFEAQDGYLIEDFIQEAISKILKQASSGTATSILATNEKSGSVILQALFYPSKTFDNDTGSDWIGSLKNMWFYLGPFAQNIREDTDEDKVLNLFDDYAISFYVDNLTNRTKVHVIKDSNGDGVPDTSLNSKSVPSVKYLWDAGMSLWAMLPNDRKIFTDVDNLANDTLRGNFIDSNASLLQHYLDSNSTTQAADIINYIRGDDIAGYRNRTVTIGSSSHVWKLGDIIYSTPKVLSGAPLNTYNQRAPYGYNDITYNKFIESDIYKHRGMVFAGANDGMLHAFSLGKITMLNTAGSDIAKLERQPATAELGSESWGFVPKNVLPYLKYYMDKDYCHLYYVDLTPYVLDASIEAPNYHNSDYFSQTKTKNSWRTVLIGGLNFGGACGNHYSESVHPPNNIPSDSGKSSYFAIDVTDPEHPTVLWEFSDNDTAFTTTGPALIHIPAKKAVGGKAVDDTTKNGYWYVVFASGPDRYNGTVHQPLYLYILDLKTGVLKRKIQLSGSGKLLGNINAFAGRMFESSIDLGTDYSDDGLYFGYNYQDGGSWKGGVLRVMTNDDGQVSNWHVSKLIDNIGPVTSSIRTMEDRNNNLWVYFGEGRYFTKDDDASTQRKIYGIKDPCYINGSYTSGCTTTVNLSDLKDVTNDASATINDYYGWYIKLDPVNASFNAERVITDPVVSTNGWVFYTTLMPTSDMCGFGGITYVWMVDYKNGGTPQGVVGSLYMQLSTGAIQKLELRKNFGSGEGAKGGRKLSTSFSGTPPPSSGISLVLPPPPVNKVIHWIER